MTRHREDRRIAGYVLVAVIIASLAYFVPRTLHEVAVDRAKGCDACLDARSATVERVEYDSGSAVGYGTSEWINAEYTFKSKDGKVVHHNRILDEQLEEGQSVTLQLYGSDLVFVDHSYVHIAWGGIETMLFLPLPPALVGLLLLRYSRPTGGRAVHYRRGYVLLAIVASLSASVLLLGGMQLVWWPAPALAIGAGIPTLALTLRTHRRAP